VVVKGMGSCVKRNWKVQVLTRMVRTVTGRAEKEVVNETSYRQCR